jgi:hypothetical protein
MLISDLYPPKDTIAARKRERDAEEGEGGAQSVDRASSAGACAGASASAAQVCAFDSTGNMATADECPTPSMVDSKALAEVGAAMQEVYYTGGYHERHTRDGSVRRIALSIGKC